METSAKRFTPTGERPRLNRKLGLGILVLGGGTFLAYYGYCWGVWGRNSLLLQYLFQCRCPSASMESRYPEYIDVLLSACQYDTFIMSPSGRFLYVEKGETENKVGYFWSLQTGEKYPYTIPDGRSYFLTDDLLFLRADYGKGVEGGEHILDRQTRIRYPIKHLDTYEINTEVLIEKLMASSSVFLIDDYWLIAIAENFQSFPERNFFTSPDVFTNEIYKTAEEFLQDNNITYTQIPYLAFDIDEVKSPDGNFIARSDGIYLAETNQKIIESYNGLETYTLYSGRNFSIYGWVYDGSGAVYSKPFGLCLFEYEFLFMDGSECLVDVHPPILKLKVPQEYLDASIP